jgi:acyl-CoA thioesterase FadM
MFRALTCPSSGGKIAFNTASGIFALCKRLHSTQVERGLSITVCTSTAHIDYNSPYRFQQPTSISTAHIDFNSPYRFQQPISITTAHIDFNSPYRFQQPISISTAHIDYGDRLVKCSGEIRAVYSEIHKQYTGKYTYHYALKCKIHFKTTRYPQMRLTSDLFPSDCQIKLLGTFVKL